MRPFPLQSESAPALTRTGRLLVGRSTWTERQKAVAPARILNHPLCLEAPLPPDGSKSRRGIRLGALSVVPFPSQSNEKHAMIATWHATKRSAYVHFRTAPAGTISDSISVLCSFWAEEVRLPRVHNLVICFQLHVMILCLGIAATTIFPV